MKKPDRKLHLKKKGFLELKNLQLHPQLTTKLVNRDLTLLGGLPGTEEASANDANEFPPHDEEGFAAFLDETVQHLEFFLQNRVLPPSADTAEADSSDDVVVVHVEGPSESAGNVPTKARKISKR